VEPDLRWELSTAQRDAALSPDELCASATPYPELWGEMAGVTEADNLAVVKVV